MTRTLCAALLLVFSTKAGASLPASNVSAVARAGLCLSGRAIPSIFLLGVAKCGTTSLFGQIRALAPGLLVAKPAPGRPTWEDKEVNFFTRDYRDYNKGMTAYAALFPACSAERLGKHAIDATPGYIECPAVAERIYRSYAPDLRPQLRFMAILRDPVSRLRSWFDHMVRKVKPDLPADAWATMGLSEIIDCARRRKIDPRVGALLFASNCAQPIVAGLYAPQIMKFVSRFAASQIAIIGFKGYVARTEHVLSHLQTFLGLPMGLGGPAAAQIDSSRADARAAVRGQINASRPPLADAVASGDGGQPRQMLEAIHKNGAVHHIRKGEGMSTFGPRASTALDAFYKPHIRELGEMLLRRARPHSQGGLLVLPTDVVPANGGTPESVTHALFA
ncbi:P-loop containing nucleoside triphosphate hydrolase protein [Pavlovales sp. CCMP2436]|nr:P-loop containing nucleoside triphosphate hydrolase protein [Pavlovales sp. CCMP2436]